MWNYRLLDRSHLNDGEPWVEIVEVFYRDDGKPSGFNEPFFNGETPYEVATILLRIMNDIEGKPVLKLSDFNLKPEDDKKVLNHAYDITAAR